ncbi:MAG TPA: hypothetical protein VFC94_07090 [Bacteroidaceae bacterium]|nr:hypothetical protein [Bacteroidaceae bacterium]
MSKSKLTSGEKLVLIIIMAIFAIWLIFALAKQDTTLYITAILYLACAVLFFIKIMIK